MLILPGIMFLMYKLGRVMALVYIRNPAALGGAKRRAGAPYPGRCGSPGPQMAMGRIEHTLLDEGRTSSPTDLRPSPATTPYHKK